MDAATPDPTTPPTPATAEPSRPLVPPPQVLVTAASLMTAAGLVQAGLLERVPLVGPVADRAVCNIITLILGFAAVMSLVVWFLRKSGYSPRVKRAIGWGLAAKVALLVAILRIERVSGDLVPDVVFRWTPSRDRLLPRAPEVAPAGDARRTAAAWTARPGDFPRFLGPDGSGGIDATLADWDRGLPRQVWRRPIGAGWSGFAVSDGHAVTLEQRGDEEFVTCLSVKDGVGEWAVPVRTRHETVLGGVGPRSTPTIRDAVVYSTGATGWLHAIDGPTGRVLWRRNVVEDLGIDASAHATLVAWGRAGSPLVTGELVIVPGGGPRTDGGAVSLVAYDRTTGERRWTGGDEQISYVSPQLVRWRGREVVLTVNEASVSAHDPADGGRVWRFDWPGHSNSDASCSQAHVLADGRVFVSKGYGVGAALFAPPAAGGDDPRPVWSQPGFLRTKFTNVVIHDGHAYGLSDGILECVRVDDGRRMWKGGRYGQGQVIRVGRRLLVQSEPGDVMLVECTPERHVVRGRLPALSSQTWNNPCVADGRLIVRNAEEAACYELDVAAPDVAAR